VKRRLVGILVLVAMVVLPGMAVAGRMATAQVIGYDRPSGALTLMSGSQEIRLNHGAYTTHLAASNPWGFPPGPCRKLAFNWNLAVRAQSSISKFASYLSLSAHYRCSVAYTIASTDSAFKTAAGYRRVGTLAPTP